MYSIQRICNICCNIYEELYVLLFFHSPTQDYTRYCLSGNQIQIVLFPQFLFVYIFKGYQ